MDDVTLARAIHVLAVVPWIGGVALVTTVLLPAVRRFKIPEERITFFESVEQYFASQSRVTTVLAGLSGLYMIYPLGPFCIGRVLVDACHGRRVAVVFVDAIHRRALVPAPLVPCPRQGRAGLDLPAGSVAALGPI
jgi:uncharacterized membrane protein